MESTDLLHPPKSPPALNILSGSTVKVDIIDCTAALKVPLEAFMEPAQPGHETLRAPAFSFLIEHGSRKLLLIAAVVKTGKPSRPQCSISSARLAGK